MHRILHLFAPVSVVYCCVTNYPPNYWLKVATILQYMLLWVWNLGGTQQRQFTLLLGLLGGVAPLGLGISDGLTLRFKIFYFTFSSCPLPQPRVPL